MFLGRPLFPQRDGSPTSIPDLRGGQFMRRSGAQAGPDWRKETRLGQVYFPGGSGRDTRPVLLFRCAVCLFGSVAGQRGSPPN